jgi:hypothetical protein
MVAYFDSHTNIANIILIVSFGAFGAICVHKQHLLVQLCSIVLLWNAVKLSCCLAVDCKKRWGKMMMADQYRKVEQYSPKSSPRGARSPVVSRQDSTGTLKTTISLGKNPSIVHSGPFYLMKEPPGKPIKRRGNMSLLRMKHYYYCFILYASLTSIPWNVMHYCVSP